MTQHIFLHIPKTAGSSVRTLLQQNYPANRTIGFSGDVEPLAWYRHRPPDFKRRYALVHGHVPYGIHEGLTDYVYFTFLRDPVERHFSDFDFLKHYVAHPLHREIASGAISLEHWGRIFEREPQFRNRMTRFVAGETDEQSPDRLSLEKAKLHLRREFAPVGLAERFDESVLVLAKRLGWNAVHYLRRNVSKNRSLLTPALRDAASAGLERDVELHAYAQDLFDELPELRDPRFAAALDEFRDVQRWLEALVDNDPHQLFVVGHELPSVSALVRKHRATPALDRYFDREPAIAA